MQRLEDTERQLRIEKLKAEIAEAENNKIRGVSGEYLKRLKYQLRYHTNDTLREKKIQQALATQKRNKEKKDADRLKKQLQYKKSKSHAATAPAEEAVFDTNSKIATYDNVESNVSEQSSMFLLSGVSIFNQDPDPLESAIEKINGLENFKP